MSASVLSDNGMFDLLTDFKMMNLSLMTEPSKCNVIWHYAELSISPESFMLNIDWPNEIIKLKPGKTSVFLTFTYFTGFRRQIPLDEIMRIRGSTGGSVGLPRIETLKEWAGTDFGFSMIFKDTEIQRLMLGNYIAVPIMDNANEIHMCIIGFIRHKLGFIIHPASKPTQHFTFFVDLAEGLQNRLSITGAVQAVGCNILKAIFKLLEKKPITEYLDLVSSLQPIPFIQIVYNIMSYFPELQVIWSAEPSQSSQKKMMDIDVAPIDRVSHKFGRSEKLLELHDKWISRREKSGLFKSLVSSVRGHSTPAKPNVADKCSAAGSSKGKTPARFSALWPGIMDIVAD
jgi:hypothetical protein